ncbi:MAG: RHS repeat protein, partial [Planctomycetes bacterium]|nr:RHS repeat protein [Planctomycetota bacterium]
MQRFIASAAFALAVCTAPTRAAQPLLEIDPIAAQPTCERTDLVLGEGPGAFHVVRRWVGDGWLTSLDAALHVDGEQAWVVTLDAQAFELVRDGEGWTSLAGAPLRVTRANDGFRLLNLSTGEVLWFDALGTPVALEAAAGRLEFEPAGFGVGGVQGVWGRLGVDRDPAGRVTALHAPGAEVSFRYEGEHLASVTGPRGDEVYSYAEGRLVQAGATRVSYDAEGRACALDGGRAPLRVEYRADPEWTVVAEVQRSAQRELLRYSEARRLLVVEGADGRSETTFDVRLRPVSVTHNGTLILRRTYDRLERLTALETAEGRTTWHYTGEDLQPSRATLPSGADVRYVRNAAGQVTLRQSPRGVERFAYDPWGALIKHRDPLGVVTTLERDAQGYCVALDRAGQVTRFARGADGEVAQITTPDGRETRFVSRGRGVLVQDERGLVYAAAYDEAGRPIAWRDASGRTLRYEYDAMGLLTRAFDGEGELLRCAYSEQGELVALTDANGNTVRYERPEPGTVVVHDPSSGDRTLRYDARGNLIEELRGDAKLGYRYDRAGRLVERQTPEGVEQLRYDAHGRVVSRRSAEATLRYSYAPDGQLAELHNTALGASIRFGYDEHGLRNEVDLPWGEQRYERDDLGRVIAVVADGERVGFDLLPDGRRAAIHYPNGVETTFAYDRERLTTIETTHEGALLERRVYAYDEAGRVTSCTDARGQTVRYTYDARGQLLSAAGEVRLDYAYDAQGNRIADALDGAQRDLELGEGNRVLAREAQRFHYDARGALVRSEGPAGETHYRYDVDGRLREVRGPGEARVRYGYAPDGSRLWREGAAGRVFELNDGTHVLGERDGGEWVTRYVHGEQVDDLLLAQREEGSYAYHTDLVRSVTAISGPEGQVAARYAYGPFGEAQLAEGPAAAWNPWRYTSRGFDPESGLYDYRARSYDPALGRFTSTDPSGRLGGVNLYAYASNDPVRFNDPWGLEATPGRGAPTEATTPNVFQRALTSMDQSATTLNPVDRAAYELVRGAGAFAGDTVMGVVDLFKKQTWVDLGEAIKAIREDPAVLKAVAAELGNGALDKFDEYVDAWKNEPWKAVRMTGYGIASVATAAVGAVKTIQTISAVAKAVKASKAAKRVAELGNAGRKARAAAAAAAAANVGRAGEQVAETGGKVAKTVQQAQRGIRQALEDM